MPHPGTGSFSSGWILNPRLDLVLFLGTPLLILPLCFAVSHRWNSGDIFLVVSTFGALGHHAPGLMRAYGDRELFRRFWCRFTIVPVLCLALFFTYPLEEMPGLMLVLLTWGLWHFLMQTYGFARIYDAKVGAFDSLTRRLDFALCVAWSGTCILAAPNRVTEFARLAMESGVNWVTKIPLEQLRIVWWIGTGAITLCYLTSVLARAWRGKPVNKAKLVLFFTTFAFFWVCAVSVKNLLLGIAMFELFHDVQYLGIVWLFNRNRVDRQQQVGRFTTLLFRPGIFCLAIYLGLVLAYGFVGFAAERLVSDRLQHVLFAIVASSTVLHFYFDGFIWKIHEPQTGSALGLKQNNTSRKVTAGAIHCGKWAVLLTVIGCLWLFQRQFRLDDMQRAQAVSDLIPDSVSAKENLAEAFCEDGNYLAAIRVCREAEELGHVEYRTHMYLGVGLTAIGQPNRGFAALQQAFELYQENSFLRFHLAMGHVRRQEFEQARSHLAAAVEIDPRNPEAWYNLGAIQLFLGDAKDAGQALTRAIALKDRYPTARRKLAEALILQNDYETACSELQTSLDEEPNNAVGLELLSKALRGLGHESSANECQAEAIRQLLRTATSQQIGQHAVSLAEDLVTRTDGSDPSALELAAVAYGLMGDYTRAIETAAKGLAIARDSNLDSLAMRFEDLQQSWNGNSNGRSAASGPAPH